MFSFLPSFLRRTSALLCVSLEDTQVKVALMRLHKASGEVKQYEEEPLSAGMMQAAMQGKPEDVITALKKAVSRIKGKTGKLPVCLSVPSELFYPAYIDTLEKQPKGKQEIMEVADTWFPFPHTELVINDRLVSAGPPPVLYLAAVQTATLQSYRAIFRQAGLSAPSCIPRTHASMCHAFGESGSAKPSIILDVTGSLPVISLCLRHTVMDERVLYGNDPWGPFHDTIQTWIPKISEGTHRPKAMHADLSAEEKKAKEQSGSGAKIVPISPSAPASADAKKPGEKIETKDAGTPPQTGDAKGARPASATEAQAVIPMVVFGEESKVFEAYTARLKNVSAVVTQFVPTENLNTSFALGLAAAYQSKTSIPTFT